MTRLCPCCRLPSPPDRIHIGAEGGRFVVFGVCASCTRRHRRIPPASARKLLNGASARAAAAPDRYWSALLPDLDTAMLAAGMLAHPTTADDTAAALDWK